mgnify:CR=1 FL=1
MSIVSKYNDSYVAFLDVLGFKNMVKHSDDFKLTKYFEEVEETLRELKGRSSKKDIGYIIISDSIILTIKKAANADDNLEKLRQLCISVSKIQKRLALSNIWLRGAIATGNTYFDDNNNQIVGPAYIDAYLLEEELAKYPRVILDNRIFKDLNFETGYDFIRGINKYDQNCDIVLYDWSKSEMVSKHMLEQDVMFFIDYFETIPSNEAEFTRIYDNIRENLFADTRLHSKYRWISIYLYTVADRRKYRDTSLGRKIKNQMDNI